MSSISDLPKPLLLVLLLFRVSPVSSHLRIGVRVSRGAGVTAVECLKSRGFRGRGFDP